MSPTHIRLALLCAGAAVALAQTPGAKITAVDLVNRRPAAFADISFDLRLDPTHPEDLTDSNVTVTSLPGENTLVPARFQRLGDRRVVRIVFTAPPPRTDKSVRVCFAHVHFIGAAPANTAGVSDNVCLEADILSQQAAADLADKLLTEAEAAAKAAKTSEEKNIFASGFVTTAGEGKTAGGADIALNGVTLGIPGASSFLRLKKTSQSETDPKHFETGLSFRSTRLFHGELTEQLRQQVEKLRAARTDADRKAATEEYNRIMARHGFWSALFVDWAMKLEGEPTRFDVANAVGEGALQFQSRTMRLFGSRRGFYRARLVAPGFEGGRSLGKGDESNAAAAAQTQKVNWIARGKAGAEFTAFYHNPETTGPIKRLELNAGGVYRYLFHDEVVWNATEKKSNGIDRGSKPWGEVNLKVFVAEDSKGRYGFKLTYNRGSLPPVFANVKAFQFGFLFESADDNAAR